MRRRTLLTVAASLALAGLPLGANALAAPAPPNGPHGCALQDVAGHGTPNVHQSDTSTIGGNSCTYTQVPTDEPTGSGGSYFAAAQSWSISTFVVNADGTRTPDPAASFSSAQGSAPVGQHVIPVGEQADVTVSNGVIIVGTPNGAPGA